MSTQLHIRAQGLLVAEDNLERDILSPQEYGGLRGSPPYFFRDNL